MTPQTKIVPYGFCHCGCGEKTNIAHCTIRKIGWVGGEPIRFIRGHANRQPRTDFSDAAPFKIDGVYCKLLPLTRGLFAIINESDYERTSKLHWYAAKTTHGFYACRKYPTKKKVTGRFLYLHRFLLGLELGEPTQGDHENGNTLDYRRDNLRPASEIQNKWNHKINKNNSTGRDGISFCKARNNYEAHMRIDGKQTNLGRRKTFDEACALREAAEKEHRGEFVRKLQ